jgi:DUF4097 and DUF4098 domain-containing protein YvlB
MRNRTGAATSLQGMGASRTTGSRVDSTDRAVLWILLALGTALMLLGAGIARGDETAHRTDRVSATLAPGSVLRLENVSGDVVATPGKEFSAVATVVVVAPTRARAEEVLRSVQLVQSRQGDELSIQTRWGDRSWQFENGRRRRWRDFPNWGDARVNARFEVTVPPGVSTRLETVNGDVRARDLDGDLRLRTVNGAIEARGVRRSLDAQTVNGNVVAGAIGLSSGASVDLGTVNGEVRLTLPKESQFDLTASTMHGAISSTFALPPRADGADKEVIRKRLREHRSGRRVVGTEEGDEGVVVDLRDLEEELEESMRDVDVEIRRTTRSVEERVRGNVRENVRDRVRGTREIWIVDPRRSYSGRVGEGGGRVRLSALNGAIVLLAAGTRAEDARPLVSGRRSFAVTIPRVHVHVPEIKVRVPEVDVHVDPIEIHVPEVKVRTRAVVMPDPDVQVHAHSTARTDAMGLPVVRGDIAGDFLSTSGTSSYRVGNVSGRVKILTHSGEIQVGSAGAAAEVKTLGGDIEIGPVRGDLAAQTLAGNVRAISVGGAARVETSGGDIRIGRVDGVLQARTGGGDIIVPLVAGAVNARTAGGDVRIAVASRQLREGISIQSGGGDVNLTLPGDFRGNLELTVTDADPDEVSIRSDFPEIAISRREGTVRGTGALNGGGEKVRVQTTSGTIRLRRGPTAQK